MHAFSDVTVLDLSQAVAGPFCTQFLGALGARVIKIEPPDGDLTRGLFHDSVFPSVNLGGKESISVDLDSDQGQEVVDELAADVDVIVENFRPGVLEKFELDYDTIAATNEDVIYCSITGFGQEGPYRDNPAYDPIVQAISGIMDTTGYPDRPPARIGTSMIDYGTGMNAAFLISAALRQRDRTGEGTHIDTSLFDVALSWMGYWMTYNAKTDETPTRSGGALSGSAPNDLYQAGDDEYVYISAPTEKQFQNLCEALNAPELGDDERFEDRTARWEHREELKTEIENEFGDYSAHELSEHLVANGVPAGPLQDIGEVRSMDQHVAAREMVQKFETGDGEQLETAALPFRINEERVQMDDTPPGRGSDSESILTELGYDNREISEMVNEGTIS